MDGRPLTEDLANEISEKLNIPTHTIKDMDQRLSLQYIPMDAPIFNSGDNNTTLQDTLPSSINTKLIEDTAQLSAIMESIGEVLNTREIHIIQSRYLNKNTVKLKDLAQEYGISAERVRQLEKIAITKIINNLKVE